MANNNKSALTYHMVCGDDIGNGCVKGCIKVNDGNLEKFDFQSVCASDTKSKKPIVDETDIKNTINDIFNHMELSFTSPAVLLSNNTRYLFGESALSKDFSMEFDVHSSKSKAEDDLSSMLTLGTLAGKALQTYYNENNTLPEEILNVEAIVAMALPIAEFVKGFDDVYKKKLLNAEHIVTFHNFQIPITVKITITAMEVLAEGSAAQYAISTLTSGILTTMLDQARKDGMKLDGIEAKHITEAQSTIGIDIGDGTVNFPVFTNEAFDRNRSGSINSGHGKILEEAVEDLSDNYGLDGFTRKDLSSFLNNPPANDAAPSKRQRYNIVAQVVENHENELANAIIRKLTKIKAKMPQLDAIFVYGGGATPVKEYLYPQLIKNAVIGTNSDLMVPVIYMNSNYSRFLNREGLFTVANAIAEAISTAKKTTSKAE